MKGQCDVSMSVKLQNSDNEMVCQHRSQSCGIVSGFPEMTWEESLPPTLPIFNLKQGLQLGSVEGEKKKS
jgi:hypothetical protein